MERATIYDYARVCASFEKCNQCILLKFCAEQRNIFSNDIDKANEIILKWCKEHPVERRQDRFLKMFPNVGLNLGVISICPCTIDTSLYKGANEVEYYRSKGYENCLQCYKDYWLAEVDE